MAQEKQAESGRSKTSTEENVGLGVFVSVVGAAGLYFLLGWAGSLVTGNNYVRLNPPVAIEGNMARYEERQPVRGFWRYFPFVDRNGQGITTVTTPEGGLVARLTDSNNNGVIENGDIVEVVEEVDGVRGMVAYRGNKVVDSDGKTEFTKPSTVLQAKIVEEGKRQRAKWNSWLQTSHPTIKAKLQEQQQQYQQRK